MKSSTYSVINIVRTFYYECLHFLFAVECLYTIKNNINFKNKRMVIFSSLGVFRMTFSSLKRKEVLTKMKDKEFDLLVIGGGITGAGIALDAASRGMKIALVEMQDFAAGTSSRSSKMIHGGLRYLKNYEMKIVSEVGKERAIVRENGPHVTTPEFMIMPIYNDGPYGKFMTSVGLSLYDFLAGVKKQERKSMLNKNEVLDVEPKFKQEGLIGGGRFVEYRTDDARLTLEVLKEATDLGALAINYTKVRDFIYEDGKVVGVCTIDQLNGQESEIRAKKIVNATGPWVDTLRAKDHSLDTKQLHASKGIHLVFDQSVFPLKQAIYFDTPDGRMVLGIPRDGKTYIGTTDTSYKGDLAHPRMTESDIDYLLNMIQFIFPDLELKATDIESSWAGVRPLIQEVGKDASKISRKDEIWESESGLVTIAGGKLTGFRKMAEKIVDVISAKFKEEHGILFSPCMTKKLPYSGGHVGGSQHFESFKQDKIKQAIELGLHQERASSLVQKYGSNIDRLFDLIQNNRLAAEKAGLPVDIYAQVLYSITDELAYTPLDFFSRRTGALLFNIKWVQKWKVPVIDLFSDILGWSKEQKENYRTELEKHLQEAAVPIDEEEEPLTI